MASRQSLRVIGELAVQYGLPAGDPCWISRMIGEYLPRQGDFRFVKDQPSIDALRDAWIAIEKVDGWDFLRDYKTRSFMMEDPPEKLKEINRTLKYDHSGSSYGWTMRSMQFIATKGWTEYAAQYD